MFRLLVGYVKKVDALNRWVGYLAMYMIFVMLGILLYSSISKTFFVPAQWTLEMAQFVMVAYYMVGGGYSLQKHAHVRMDLLYGKWRPKTKAWADSITMLFMLFYLVMLLYGGISSTHYALKYGEESYSAWAPYMAPIKIIMVIGIILMLLQAIATLIRNIAEARGIEIE
jgi:TRAP-type mannitol/chloroaromatic compound transport system permease small subunit